MAQAQIDISTSGEPALVSIARRAEIDDTFWLRLGGELSGSADVGRDLMVLPAERFLQSRTLLRSVCSQYQVRVSADERTRQLLATAEAERGALRELLDTAPTVAEEEVHTRLAESRFQRTLTPFQVRDLQRLLALPHGANFSVPGAGKTTTTYALYEAERCAGNVRRLLVVGPLSSFEAWEEEAIACLEPAPTVARYENDLPWGVEVLLISYQRLIGHYDRIASWVSANDTHVVLDEAHRMKKGRGGAWGTACLDLAYIAGRRDILTGTPAPQSPRDLEVLFDFVWPSQGARLVPDEARRPDPPPELTAQIARRISPLFVRTRKAELGLPGITHHPERIQLEGIHQEIYDALRDQYAGKFELDRQARLSMTQLGRVMMYLLEAATNPALLVAGASRHDPIEFQHPPLDVPEGSALHDLLQDYHQYETPPKLLRLAQIVNDNARQGRKTLVWTNFVRNLTTLQRQLSALEPALIHGGVPTTGQDGEISRETELARFRHDDDCWVLLANPASIGEGVSLHRACHDAVYVDRTFNAGQYLQSVDRIHRLGLPPETITNITSLVTENTIDEIVDDRVRTKASVLGALLDDPDVATLALPDEDDYGSPLDTDQDLQALLLHLGQTRNRD